MNYLEQLSKIHDEERKVRAKRDKMRVIGETWSLEAQIFLNDVIRPIIAKRKIIEQIVFLELELNKLKN